MKLVIIIALAFVLLVPSVAFAEEFRYDWLETWEKLGISGTTQLQGIVIDGKDNLYVIDSNRLVKLNTDNQREWLVIHEIHPSGGIYLNQNDEVMVPVSHKEINEVRKYSHSGELIKTWNVNDFDISEDLSSGVLYVDKNENFYFLEREFNRSDSTNLVGTLKKFDSSGNLVKSYQNMGLLKHIDDDGNLYTTIPGKVIKHDQNGNKLAEYGKQKYRGGVGTFAQQAEEIIVSDGLIFATGGQFGPINIIDQDGNFKGISSYGLGEKRYGWPRGIALDSEKTAYITDYGRGNILVYEKVIINLEYHIEQFLEIKITEDNPAWIQNIFDWHYADKISYKEVLDALKYLESKEIISEVEKK